MFIWLNLVLQWVPGSGKVVQEDTKMSPGRVSPGELYRSWGYEHTFLYDGPVDPL